MRATSRVLQVSSARSRSIGFIGLGAMGREMAANLVAKTSALTAKGAPKPRFVLQDFHEPVPSSLARLVTGSKRPQSVSRFLLVYAKRHADLVALAAAAGIARQCATIITMLPSSPQVTQVYCEEEVGILAALEEHADEPALCIDCTTLDQAVAKNVSAQVRAVGSDMLDAPVSGGVVGANAGTLSFMVGGARRAFDLAEPLFAMMGRRAIYCGESGNGLAAKIANNMLGTAEAMLLGTKLGLDAALLAEILNTSTGKCWSSEVNNPFPGALPKLATRPPADREYQGGFMSKLMAKDLQLAMQAADEQKMMLPSTTLAARVYDRLAGRDEYAMKDFSVVLQWLRDANLGTPGNDNTEDTAEEDNRS